jgi:osmoprotectant transport system ATP-binding protein
MAARELEFADVSFTASGGHSILHEVSLRVPAGQRVALLGRSGSGKTTLLRTVNALVVPTSGQVLVGGLDTTQADAIALRRSIGYVIQESGLFPHMTVAENARLPLQIGCVSAAETGAVVERALQSVDLPIASFGERYPWQLSGGQRQRAGVARALVNQPSVLLLDEPFGALDPITRAEMQTMLRALLQRLGTTTLLVTHDLDEALYLADRVVLLEQGRVVADLASSEVLRSENPAMSAYVAATRPIASTGDAA